MPGRLRTDTHYQPSHPHTPDDERWDQPNRVYNDCGDDTEITTPAAIHNLPPVKVKTELRKRIGIKVIMSDEINILEDRDEVDNTATKSDMTQDAENKPEGHEKAPVEIDKITIRRLSNKENVDRGGSCETISVGCGYICYM